MITETPTRAPETDPRAPTGPVNVNGVGFVSARVDEHAYRTTFDLESRSGSVILNLSTLPFESFDDARGIMRSVMNAGLGMGRFFTMEREGNGTGGRGASGNRVVVGTVCGITLNGILRASGIPVASRFGGLLEMREGKPARFTQIINYESTTIDPIEIFIKSKMMRVYEAALTGNGTVGASFREIPAAALPEAKQIIGKLERLGLCGALLVGEAGRSLLDVSVSQNRAGAIVAAGLNPIAAIEERGIPTESYAMSSVCDFEDLIPAF